MLFDFAGGLLPAATAAEQLSLPVCACFYCANSADEERVNSTTFPESSNLGHAASLQGARVVSLAKEFEESLIILACAPTVPVNRYALQELVAVCDDRIVVFSRSFPVQGAGSVAYHLCWQSSEGPHTEVWWGPSFASWPAGASTVDSNGNAVVSLESNGTCTMEGWMPCGAGAQCNRTGRLRELLPLELELRAGLHAHCTAPLLRLADMRSDLTLTDVEERRCEVLRFGGNAVPIKALLQASLCRPAGAHSADCGMVAQALMELSEYRSLLPQLGVTQQKCPFDKWHLSWIGHQGDCLLTVR